jgi:hypothetical protein
MNGQITEYNPYNKRGIVSGPDGEHAFDASAELASDLSNTIIPPDTPVDVTYDVAGTGEAINVRLTQTVNLAASADPMAIRNFAAQKTPAAPAEKSASKKKSSRPRLKRPRRNLPAKRPRQRRPQQRSRPPGNPSLASDPPNPRPRRGIHEAD